MCWCTGQSILHDPTHLQPNRLESPCLWSQQDRSGDRSSEASPLVFDLILDEQGLVT